MSGDRRASGCGCSCLVHWWYIRGIGSGSAFPGRGHIHVLRHGDLKGHGILKNRGILGLENHEAVAGLATLITRDIPQVGTNRTVDGYLGRN